MNINIYLEDILAKSLQQYVKKLHKSRNAIIREALKEWVNRHEIKHWPNSILNFKGVPKILPFESFRDDLLPPKEESFE